jgi:SNF2 family DNA or RNA helicase
MPDGEPHISSCCTRYFCDKCGEGRCDKCGEDGGLLLSLPELTTLFEGRNEPGRADEKLTSSPKFERLLATLKTIPTSPNEHGVMVREKTLVFSQWTSALDLLEPHLRAAGYEFGRIDGSLSQADRAAALKGFEESPSKSVILLSLMAASTGLNMAFANHVILLDFWWNPTVEDQAVDRCHRIGQKKEVHVYRLVMDGSLESQVLALQKNKRDMVDGLLYGIVNSKGKKLDDLEFLIKGLRRESNYAKARQVSSSYGNEWDEESTDESE